MEGSIALKGSTRLITEFFEYSISTILYQRGVYPEEDFSKVKKYDITLMKTVDDELKTYIRKILIQVHNWVLGGKCHKLVICIIDKDDGSVTERWAFDIVRLAARTEADGQEGAVSTSEQSVEETRKQIRALIRQITASVTFLPELSNEGNYTFNVLAYTDAYTNVPMEWGDSDSKEIEGGEVVQFKNFSTNDHKVSAEVSYRF
ncbi:spindle checkpoint protein MAD2 KNAG_0I01790 [Huiozyma naganishii CBS 8797]|uniref:HORMA domain-containing protein n=1 Tax=Huiozyma naganishii (strain ATCC MYA-139 / BCRC 22969 / CBS 8797 / KCTC 17520 / NBRC 10181 / NCYC 3082 / Yp74L-3) TaxID=1071383 RepID=J7S997_HUIN7|nr:hypothetical protein KNAG_0I01790 [Kazachstania naganishii CBS 8797]CCK71964.1 hypothetical protein KNAG_0I01790 [Kazachstania naganishii CBS 8797]